MMNHHLNRAFDRRSLYYLLVDWTSGQAPSHRLANDIAVNETILADQIQPTFFDKYIGYISHPCFMQSNGPKPLASDQD